MSSRRQRNRKRAFCKAAVHKGVLASALRMAAKEFLIQSGGVLWPVIRQSRDYHMSNYLKGFVIPTEMRADALFTPPSTEYVTMTRRTIPTRMSEVREMVMIEQVVEVQRIMNRVREILNRRMLMSLGEIRREGEGD